MFDEKNKFKTLLWDKLTAKIQEDPELQTEEEPENLPRAESKKGQEWIAPDELSAFIRSMHPEWDERRIFIERWIEETIVPKFIGHEWPVELAECEENAAWTGFGQEQQCILISMGMCDAL